MNMENIVLDEIYESDAGSTTYYFISPKELLTYLLPYKDYKEAVSMEISIDFPTKHIEPKYASVCISPTRDIDGVMDDYDWTDVDLAYEEIDKLIEIARMGFK